MFLYWNNRIPVKNKIKIIEEIWIKFLRIGFTSIEAISDSLSFKFRGFNHIWPSYHPDSSYSTFSDVNLLNILIQPRYSLIDISKGRDKLLKRLMKMYFNICVLKYMLPDEITIKTRKVAIQKLINTSVNDFFDFAQENIYDLDNSRNSLVGCCSFGTGHLDSFI